MSEGKFTSGPWSGEIHELSEGLSGIVYDANGYCVADHLKPCDVCVIAAAPDLVEALEDLLGAYGPRGDRFTAAAIAALRKARAASIQGGG